VVRRTALTALAGIFLFAGCGGTKHAAPSVGSTASSTTRSTTTSPSAGSTSGPGALQAEAQSAATGDIPDNQVFLVFHDRSGAYSMKYPEGWAQQGSGKRVTFRDKNNIVRIVVGAGSTPTVEQARAEMRRLPRVHVTQAPIRFRVGGTRAVKVVYTTQSAPNPVTGKRVTLVVDRYYLGRSRRRAVIDLGTPRGVDNVDAYRLMIESFRWR
jgi:hypothetical protein